MALVLETGAGLTTADTYSTVATADTYHSNYGNPSGWAGVKAQGKLTLIANPANTETLIVGTKTYTFQTTLTDVDGNIEIGSDLSVTTTNIINAVTLGGTPGTGYALSMTVHSTVIAEGRGYGIVIFTANNAGTTGNQLAFSETFANTSNIVDATTIGTETAGVEPPMTSEKEESLRISTAYIDAVYGERFLGGRMLITQALMWPRGGVITSDGFTLADDELPPDVITATQIMALKHQNGDTLIIDVADSGTISKSFAKVGPLATLKEWDGGKGLLKWYREVDLLLRGLIAGRTPVERG